MIKDFGLTQKISSIVIFITSLMLVILVIINIFKPLENKKGYFEYQDLIGKYGISNYCYVDYDNKRFCKDKMNNIIQVSWYIDYSEVLN